MPTRRQVLVGLAVLVLLVAVGAAVAYFSISSRLSPSDTDLEAVEAVLDSTEPTASVEPTNTVTYILLLGNDRREGQSWARSDTIILARLDSATESVSLVSIPRDTRVTVPGYGTTKINHAAAYGGPALAIETVQLFTGLPIHHYVELDFEGFEQIVDAVGGVDVDVEVSVEYEGVYVAAGSQTLNGEEALTWIRDRSGYASGDFARMENQQAFLLALAEEMTKSSNLSRLPSILNETSKHIQTDLSVAELVSLVSDYSGIDASTMYTASVPGTTGTIDGVSYVLADEEATAALFADLEDGGLSEMQ